MTSSLYLGIALDGAGWHPSAWREPDARPADLFHLDYWVALVRAAEAAGIDLVTIEDSFGLQSSGYGGIDPRRDEVRGRLDALLLATSIAPHTSTIGLVPTITTTHTEPFHVATGVQTLDYVSGGRAGWRVQVSGRAHEAAHVGRRTLPRPPQGQPLVYALAHQKVLYELAVAGADIVGVTPHDDAHLEAILGHLETAAREVSRGAGEPLRVWSEISVLIEETADAAQAALARLNATHGEPWTSDTVILADTAEVVAAQLLHWHLLGIDGVRLRPARLPEDLTAITERVVPLLRSARVLDRPDGAATLRARLGFGRPENRYATPAEPDPAADSTFELDLTGSIR